MKDYRPLFIKLFENRLSNEEFKKFSNKLKRIIEKAFKTFFTSQTENLFQKYHGSDYLQVLVQELFKRFLHKKEIIKNLEEIHENYILISAKNLIYYHLCSEFKFIAKEIKFEDLVLQENSDFQEDFKIEDTLPKYVTDHLENLKTIHIINSIKKFLSKKDLETLCWYIYKHIYQQEFPTNIKRDIHYKRWGRIKNKLKNVFEEPFQVEEIPAPKLFEIIRSEICEKLYYK